VAFGVGEGDYEEGVWFFAINEMVREAGQVAAAVGFIDEVAGSGVSLNLEECLLNIFKETIRGPETSLVIEENLTLDLVFDFRMLLDSFQGASF
jgi:hypothetical protein